MGVTTFNRKQYQDVVTQVVTYKGTFDLASLADGAGSTQTFTVPGVRAPSAGPSVVSVAHGVDLAGITVTGYVSAANTVAVRFQNESGGVLDLASATIYIVVEQIGDHNFV